MAGPPQRFPVLPSPPVWQQVPRSLRRLRVLCAFLFAIALVAACIAYFWGLAEALERAGLLALYPAAAIASCLGIAFLMRWLRW